MFRRVGSVCMFNNPEKQRSVADSRRRRGGKRDARRIKRGDAVPPPGSRVTSNEIMSFQFRLTSLRQGSARSGGPLSAAAKDAQGREGRARWKMRKLSGRERVMREGRAEEAAQRCLLP